MTIVRRIARPLLAAPFVAAGLDAVLHPLPRSERARPLVDAAAPQLGLPRDPELVVRVAGGAVVGAGALLAVGRLPRLSALVLAAAVVPATYLDHPFWQEKDPERARAARRAVLTNLGLLGGLLLAGVDTQGRPGLAWRGRHAVQQAERSARHLAKDARRAARAAQRTARLEAREALRTAQAALPS